MIAIELFDLYFDRCAIHNGLLSVEFHTPQLVASRSPFLFTCITAVASKFYIKKPDLYSKVMEAAQDLAVDVIRSAYKSVEVIQGFLLLTTWSQPSFRYEEDKSWTYAGLGGYNTNSCLGLLIYVNSHSDGSRTRSLSQARGSNTGRCGRCHSNAILQGSPE